MYIISVVLVLFVLNLDNSESLKLMPPDTSYAHVGEYPYQIVLSYEKWRNVPWKHHIRCSGVIMTEKYVGTACSCVVYYNLTESNDFSIYKPYEMAVIVPGRTKDLSKTTVDGLEAHKDYPVVSYYVNDVIPHPSCRRESTWRGWVNNIAALELVDSFVFTNWLQAIKIHNPTRDYMAILIGHYMYSKDKELCDTSSFGVGDMLDAQLNQTKLIAISVKINIISYEDCARLLCVKNPEHYCSMNFEKKNEVCFNLEIGDPNKAYTGLCVGDVGSPIVCNGGHLFGLISWISTCTGSKQTVYTMSRIDKYIPFYNQLINVSAKPAVSYLLHAIISLLCLI